MKKHKSVVAILLAVMMIFTMMPTLAFAAEATGWGDEYATVTDKDKDTYKAARVFGSDGLITATATDQFAVEVVGKSGGVAPTNADGSVAKKYFYQLNGAKLSYAKDKALDGSTWTQTAFGANAKGEGEGLIAKLGFTLVEPDYCKAKATDTAKTAFAAGTSAFGAGYTVEYKTTGYDPAKITEDQKVTVTATISVAKDAKIDGNSAATAEFFGSREYTAQVTVQGLPMTPERANFYWDTVGGTKLADGMLYDGAEHKVVVDTVPDWTISFTQYNQTTGKYEPVSAVTVKDVLEKPLDVKYTWTKGTEQKGPYSLAGVNLTAAQPIWFNYDGDASLTDPERGYYYSVPGEEYNAVDYIVVEQVNPLPTTGKEYTDEKKAENKAINAATKKAIAANDAQLKAYFNEKYEVKAETSKSNPGKVDLTIVEKDLTSAEKEALAKKYAGLFLNFGKEEYITFNADVKAAHVYLNGGLVDFEVEFTKAPVGTTTFKANKKGKLAKNKTISVKATAANGAPVYYKLINANSKIKIDKKTGKITFKKGLKKGTYKFSVKAYVPASELKGENMDYINWYEYQTIKVKIKK